LFEEFFSQKRWTTYDFILHIGLGLAVEIDAIQRGNAAAVLGTVDLAADKLDAVFVFII